MTPRIVACGDDALRAEIPAPLDRHGVAARLKQDAAWLEVVVGRESVTVQFDPLSLTPDEARARLLTHLSLPADENVATVQISHALTLLTDPEMSPDLNDCAQSNGTSPEAFLQRILTSPLTVDMLGFAPGFSYVSGVDPQLIGGRLAHPRSRVPAGSVGFIEGFLGIYALEGPGGWPIIGRIREPLFRASEDQPFVLLPGHGIELVRG